MTRQCWNQSFQSTPSAWRETYWITFPQLMQTISIHSLRMEGDHPDIPGAEDTRYFNPLPPHGGRPVIRSFHDDTVCISIHSLRMEGDWSVRAFAPSPVHFNPLPPHGGRRCRKSSLFKDFFISIHSLRMEGDAISSDPIAATMSFQSTPSAWRETRKNMATYRATELFQSTPSAWRETLPGACAFLPSISFQSTPSAWRETCIPHDY